VMGYQEEPLVSIDFLGTPQAVFVDGRWTRVSRDRMVKLVLWYDNEWGYSHRVLGMIALMSQWMQASAKVQTV
jgi:glyceraldehyde-3-phosphate dehydrogenase/erythrose-4-phosphate dehydrogenase